jgi:predicted amidophosphoribosyltransferase
MTAPFPVSAQLARRWLREAAVWLFPSDCFACGCPLTRSQLLGACLSCWTSLAAVPRARCNHCALPLPSGAVDDGPARGRCARCAVRPLPFDRAIAAVDYGDVARRFLLRAKNGHRAEILRPLAEQLAAAVTLSRLAHGIDGIVPVPSSLLARLSRGFNPASELAGAVARAARLPVWDDVVRKRGLGGPAVKALRAPARWVGAGRRLALRRTVPGAKILLVDDVLTTGATAAACAAVLRSGGAMEVRVAVWARTPSHPARFDRSRAGRL